MTVEPLVAVLATVVTFINTGYWELSMLLLPVGIVIVSVFVLQKEKENCRKLIRQQTLLEGKASTSTITMITLFKYQDVFSLLNT